jgi:excisionase family DNA binding protein
VTGHGPGSRVTITLEDLADRDFAVVPEVSVILRVDPRTIRRHIANGTIPATRVGAEWRVPVRWLREAAGAGERP